MAWEPLGWECAGVAEIAAFPSAVLAHHFPEVRNHGDFTKIEAGDIGPIDLLVGGTPCQSFSLAGLRRGLADDRGNLALEFLRLADRTRPRWLLWENVPGVLSSNGGRDFGSILGGMVELGYGFFYRVLDAQYFGLAQRRKRVFLVGYLGDWRPPAAVLLERESLSWNPAPRRAQGKDFAPTISSRATGGGGLGTNFDLDGGLIAHTLRGEGHDASEDGTGRGTPIIPVAFGGNNQSGALEVATALNAKGGTGRCDFESETFIAFDCKAGANTGFAVGDIPGALRGEGNGGGHNAVAFALRGREASEESAAASLERRFGVRRLTPRRECERLQGFPDDFTRIPWRGKPAEQCPDGPRYRALGNSMAVPVMAWIGQRIDAVEAVMSAQII